MKRAILPTLFLFLSMIVYGQESTLTFLGIPVDGPKNQMIAELKKKGFTYQGNDILSGPFNGKSVHVGISTNKGKVDRVYVAFPKTDEGAIRIEYNNLLNQFKRSSKYIGLDNPEIPEDEDISYEILVHNKRYDANFYLKPEMESDTLQKRLVLNILKKYTPEQYMELSQEKIEEEISSYLFGEIKESLVGSVWFTIFQQYGRYYIGLYYDNLKNRPDGEDL